MSETNAAHEDCRCETGKTMSIGDAAAMLGLSTAQVRRLCKAHERNENEGLAFRWSAGWAPHTDIHGRVLRGHRLPYADAVRKLNKAKQRVERDPSV